MAVPTAPISASNLELEVEDTAGTYVRIPGAASFSSAGGEANVQEQAVFGGTVNIPGQPGAGSVNVDVPALAPLHRASIIIDTSRRASTQKNFRVTLPESEVVGRGGTGVTAAIETTGVVTFVGAGAPMGGGNLPNAQVYGPGYAIRIGSDYHHILSISSMGQITVGPAPGTAITATQYSIVVPGIRTTFLATIQSFALADATAGGGLGSSLTLVPTSDLPWWVASP